MKAKNGSLLEKWVGRRHETVEPRGTRYTQGSERELLMRLNRVVFRAWRRDLHERTGLLVEQESPDKLAEALIFFYENPEKRVEMGRAARERAASQFSSLSIAARFRNEVS